MRVRLADERASRLLPAMDCTSPTPAEVKIVARTFASFPLQSTVDVHLRTAIDLGRVEYDFRSTVIRSFLSLTSAVFYRSLLEALTVSGVLESIEVDEGKKVYQTLERSLGSGAVFNSIREFLSPYRAITQEELTKAKEEAKRLEQSILVLKMQLQSRPKAQSSQTEPSPKLSSQALKIEKARLENEILRIDHDIGKYISVTKLILADLAEINGTSTTNILQRLNASRTLQELLM